MLIIGDSENRRLWNHGLVCELLKGKDNVVRGVRMIVRNKIWERSIQLVCPLEIKSKMTEEELNCRIRAANKEETQSAKTVQKNKRVIRQTGQLAKLKIKQMAEDDEQYS